LKLKVGNKYFGNKLKKASKKIATRKIAFYFLGSTGNLVLDISLVYHGGIKWLF